MSKNAFLYLLMAGIGMSWGLAPSRADVSEADAPEPEASEPDQKAETPSLSPSHPGLAQPLSRVYEEKPAAVDDQAKKTSKKSSAKKASKKMAFERKAEPAAVTAFYECGMNPPDSATTLVYRLMVRGSKYEIVAERQGPPNEQDVRQVYRVDPVEISATQFGEFKALFSKLNFFVLPPGDVSGNEKGLWTMKVTEGGRSHVVSRLAPQKNSSMKDFVQLCEWLKANGPKL